MCCVGSSVGGAPAGGLSPVASSRSRFCKHRQHQSKFNISFCNIRHSWVLIYFVLLEAGASFALSTKSQGVRKGQLSKANRTSRHQFNGSDSRHFYSQLGHIRKNSLKMYLTMFISLNTMVRNSQSLEFSIFLHALPKIPCSFNVLLKPRAWLLK